MSEQYVYVVYAMTDDWYDDGHMHSVHGKPESAIATAGLILATHITYVGRIDETWVLKEVVHTKPVDDIPRGEEIARFDLHTIEMYRHYAEKAVNQNG